MNYLILLFLLAFNLIAGNAQDVVFADDFSDNRNAWLLPNDTYNQTAIVNGEYRIQHQGELNNFITQYVNQLDDKADFTVTVEFRTKKPGSKYGIIWGAIDEGDANFFYVQNLQYSISKVRKNKISDSKSPAASMRVKLDKNILRIEKKGGEIHYLVNGHAVYKENYGGLAGKAFGFCAAGNSVVGITAFSVNGKKLPVRLAPNLHYPEEAANLGAAINSVADDLTPVVTPDGKGLFFTRRMHPENTGGAGDLQDVYYAEFKNGQWGKAKNIGKPVNTDDPNAVCSVTPDGNTILLMNTYGKDGAQRAMGVSVSHKSGGEWSAPTDLRIRSFYNKSAFNEYFLGNDGNVLLMAVERDDTYGSRDIYVSFLLNDNTWSAPKNIGGNVNTPGIELSPFLASDGKTLYFSSTGHPGYGKNDIFVTRRLDDTWENWSEPYNIGAPVNSTGYDAYYSVPASGDYAYFVSSDQSIGKQDIFRIRQPEPNKPNPVVLVHGKVLNSKTLAPIQTDINYSEISGEIQAGSARSNAGDGYYKIVLPYGKEFSFFALKQGFYSVSGFLDLKNLEKKEYQEIERDLLLTPIEIGVPIQMYNVFFHRGNAELKPESYPELNRLVKLLKENSAIEIELGGHTDHPEWSEKNLQLSEDRWKSVKKYLISQGIGETRVSGKGYAGDQPLFPNDSEENRRKNRRVEFTITKM